MKSFQIFKPGRQISAAGTTINFTEDDLRAAVAAYDPTLHEAPMTVGHPKDNLPAYGWVQSLEYDEAAQSLMADPNQVEEQFSEMVEQGRFKKRSASFYLPDSPANPKPGSYYLRHVAFLGAHPPAVKGLKEVEFSEDVDAITVEFGELDAWSVARMFRNLREFIVDRFDLEAADNAVPSWAVEDLEYSARNPDPQPDTPMPEFNEGDNEQDSEDDMTEIERLKAELKKRDDRLAEFNEREATLKRQELHAAITAYADDGRILPAHTDQLVDFAQALDNESTVEFGEGDQAKPTGLQDAFLAILGAMPKQVDFSERSGGEGDPAKVKTPEQQAGAIRKAMREAEENGRAISYSEALHRVQTAETVTE